MVVVVLKIVLFKYMYMKSSKCTSNPHAYVLKLLDRHIFTKIKHAYINWHVTLKNRNIIKIKFVK